MASGLVQHGHYRGAWFCWSLDCSGVMLKAQFELVLQVTEEFKHGKKWTKNQYKKLVQGLL